MKKLIVGLGNPEKKHEKTRHNAGFIIVDELARLISDEEPSFGSKFDAEIYDIDEYVFLKPQTYMNKSGAAVQKAVSFYKIPLDQVCVIHDDADIEEGEFKFQIGKAAAGHRGVADIIEKLGSNDFWRARMGIRRPPNDNFDLEDWVLKKLSDEEITGIMKNVEKVKKEVEKI